MLNKWFSSSHLEAKNMKRVTKGQLVLVAHQPGEDATQSYVQEASALGLTPGDFPPGLIFEDADLGNPILRRCTVIKAGDLNSGWTYRNHHRTIKLDVLNK